MRNRCKTFPAFKRCYFSRSRLNKLPESANLNKTAQALGITRTQLSKWIRQGLPYKEKTLGKVRRVLVGREPLKAFLVATGRAKIPVEY
jgi:transposase-like protein